MVVGKAIQYRASEYLAQLGNPCGYFSVVLRQSASSLPFVITLNMAVTMDVVACPTSRNGIVLAVGHFRTFIVIVM